MADDTATPEKAATTRTGRNLPVAVGVGVLLGALVLGSLYTVKQIFAGVIAVFLALAVVELSRALASREIRIPLIPVLVGSLAMLAGAYFGGAVSLLGSYALTVLAVLGWRMFSGDISGYVRDVTAGVFVAAYVPLLAGFVVLLLVPPDGPGRIVTWIVVTICSDIGGYFAGILIGRHKMSPIISPKKTWEGFAGSTLACVAGGALTVRYLLGGELWQGAILGVVVVLVATMGDLVESVIKRDLGIKDMGTLLPGHGGVMDRLDSLLATVVPAWLLLSLFIS